MGDDGFAIGRRARLGGDGGGSTDRGVAPGRLASTNYLRNPNSSPIGEASVTGNGYVDHGAVCDRGDGPDCFLNSDVRARLIEEYQHRVEQAEMFYFQALQNVRADTLVEKDEDLPWWASLLLGVISSQLASGMEAALKALRGGIRPMMLGAQMAEQRFRARVTGAIANLSDDAIKDIGKKASDAAKDPIKNKSKSAANRDHASEKADAVSLISVLQEKASVRYDQIRQGPPGTATDAQLLVLFDGMDREHHSISNYELEIRSTVDKYKKSHARMIGVHDELHEVNGVKISGDHADTHTKVAWIKYGHATKLCYMEQQFEQGDKGMFRDDDERAQEDHGALEAEPRYIDFVEDDFIDVAIIRHEIAWGAPPKTYEWVVGVPPRLREVTSADRAAVAGAVKAVPK